MAGEAMAMICIFQSSRDLGLQIRRTDRMTAKGINDSRGDFESITAGDKRRDPFRPSMNRNEALGG